MNCKLTSQIVFALFVLPHVFNVSWKVIYFRIFIKTLVYILLSQLIVLFIYIHL